MRTRAALGIFAIALAVASLVPPSAVHAGACAQFGTLAATLVSPGGLIALAPGAGPLLEVGVGGRRVSSGRQRLFADPFRRLSVRGPGSPRVTHREIAPGIHRVEGAFRVGTYRVAGIEGGGSVTFARATPAPIEAPVLASAHIVLQQGQRSVLQGGGTVTTRRLDVTLSSPPPPGAAWLLMHYAVARPDRVAMHSAPVGPGRTSFVFSAGGDGGRCGPSLPRGGVPVSGTQVSASWLARDGRTSGSSALVTTTEGAAL